MNLNEVYEMLKDKIKEMHGKGMAVIEMDYSEIAALYQIVCFMKQIKHITNGWE